MIVRKLLRHKMEKALEKAFRESDWLMLCVAARVLIRLTEGPGMKPLPRGMAFRWRGGGPWIRKQAA